MGIPVPDVGKIFYTQFSAQSTDSIILGLSNALEECGWSEQLMPATAVLVVNAVPANGDTITVGSITYTFVSGANFNNAKRNQINLENATVDLIVTRIFEIVNAGLTGAGTDYSSATILPNPQFTAQFRDFANTLEFIATSLGTQTPNLSVTGTSMGFQQITSGGGTGGGGGSQLMTTAQTPQGLAGGIFMDGQSGYVRIRMGTAAAGAMSAGTLDLDRAPGVFSIATGNRVQEFCGCAHQFFTWVRGDSNSPGCVVAGGVPYIRPYHTATFIRAVFPGTPITVQTTTPHGFVNGQQVFISDVLGTSAANGVWSVTVLNAYSFTLNGSGNFQPYVWGGMVATTTQIARCMWMSGTSVGSNFSTFRNSLGPGVGTGNNFFGCVNQFYWSTWNNPTGLMLEIPKIPNTETNNGIAKNWGQIADAVEANLGWCLCNPNSALLKYGQLWGAFVEEDPIPMDRVRYGFPIAGGVHDCINLTDGYQEPRGALWLLKN
jgi:hypothetical protein